jgi:metal-responsive CopG/Arc/MetJ family transcriptional regulator
MKTAISIPDPIFDAAEKMAKELAMSRSELYAKAVAEFVAAHSAESITERINAVMETETNELDPVLQEMQIRVLRNSPW